MTAVIVDLKDRLVKTPEQTVKDFFSVYTPGSVKNSLWEIFMSYAMRKQVGDNSLIPETEMVLLFDDMVDLVAAVYKISPVTGEMLPTLIGDN